MPDLNEHNIDGEIIPGSEVVEIEPGTGRIIDEFIPIINLTTIPREELRRLLESLIIKA